MHASQARSRILGATNLQVPARRPFLSQSGFHTDCIFGQVRNTTVQVWTIGEGFGIGSEFSQTCCAANNFRDHEVLLPCDQSATARLWISPPPILVGKPHKKNRFKRFCASSISLSGFHVVTLFNVFIYFTFLD